MLLSDTNSVSGYACCSSGSMHSTRVGCTVSTVRMVVFPPSPRSENISYLLKGDRSEGFLLSYVVSTKSSVA